MKSKVMNLKLVGLGLFVLIGVVFRSTPLKALPDIYGCQARKNNICMILNIKGKETLYYGIIGGIK